MNKRAIGMQAEEQACQYLEKQGYHLRIRNFQCKFGEIDLIMDSPDNEIVFVEVRYRQHSHFGGAIASITSAKQRKIIQTAEYYLQKYGLHHKSCRFDVVTFDTIQQQTNLQWITNAFQV